MAAPALAWQILFFCVPLVFIVIMSVMVGRMDVAILAMLVIVVVLILHLAHDNLHILDYFSKVIISPRGGYVKT